VMSKVTEKKYVSGQKVGENEMGIIRSGIVDVFDSTSGASDGGRLKLRQAGPSPQCYS
jgi:hypothetical protein